MDLAPWSFELHARDRFLQEPTPVGDGRGTCFAGLRPQNGFL